MGSLGLTCDQVKINFPVGISGPPERLRERGTNRCVRALREWPYKAEYRVYRHSDTKHCLTNVLERTNLDNCKC
jgi:hypothetical protein